MAIQTAPGVSQRMLPDGHLELSCAATLRQVRCEPAAAAMWIALRQHDGDLDRAAAALADTWQVEPAEARYDMVTFFGSLCAYGLLTEDS